jgi:hypothetical protein
VPSLFISKRVIVTDGTILTREEELDARAWERAAQHVNTHDHRGRKKGCGAWTVCGEKTAEGKVQYHRVYCKCWDCRFCGPRRALRTKRAIIQHAKAQGLSRLLTLTLDPKKLHGQDSTKYINSCFADLRVYLQRKYGKSITYIRVLEYQKNGNAHFHVLIDRFIPQAWISHAWQAVGGGSHVHITQIRKMRFVAGYLAKYLTKDMLQSAPQGTRRVTTSRTIKLFEKPPGDTTYELIRLPIEVLRAVYAAVEAKFDEGGFLQAFAVGLVVLP